MPEDVAAYATGAIAAGDWLVVLPVITCIFGAAVGLMLRRQPALQHVLAVAVFALTAAECAALLALVLGEGPMVMTMGNWPAPFGITFAVDVLGASLALVATTVVLACAVYSIPSINDAERRYGFYPLLMVLTAGICGAFLTGDLFNLYVWFEVLLVATFGLLVIGSEPAQIDGTIKYGVLNLIATTLVLVATALLYGLTGTLNMADIAGRVRELDDSAPILTVTVLFLIAFGMKAAAFPVNFWLPAAYHTPRLVASAVFAALLTKVGVYALMRTLVMLLPESTGEVSEVVLWVAGVTMLTGAVGAVAQSDVRRLFGYLVISGIGMMLTGVALLSELALTGAVFYAAQSMVVTAGLFLAAGLMRRITGSFDLRSMGGIYAASPLLAAMFLILAFAVSGLPPFSGFWAKVVLVDAALAADAGWIAAAILVTGLLTTIATGRVWLFAFWRGGPEGTPDGETVAMPRAAGRADAVLIVPVVALVALAVAAGLVPAGLFDLAERSATGLLEPAGYVAEVFPGGAR